MSRAIDRHHTGAEHAPHALPPTRLTVDGMMAPQNAHTARRADGEPRPDSPSSAERPAAAPIEVEIRDGTVFAADMESRTHALAIADLAGRAAEPNPFMHPAFIKAAAAEYGPAAIAVLFAWRGEARDPHALLGALVLRRLRTPFRLWSASVEGRFHDFSFLSTPVVDASALEPVLTAILDAMAGSSLPKRLSFSLIGDEGPVMTGLKTVLRQRHSPLAVMASYRRALARSDNPAAFTPSASTRKKLRQYRRRLAEQGPVAVTRHQTPAEVTMALEEFLQLEASGWKGRAGTALISRAADADFARAAFPAMAATGDAVIDVLRLDGKAAAIQILARSGRGYFTWKIAYDEALRDYSPGVLLVEDYTTHLMSDPAVGFLDSCSHDDTGFMAALWKDRQPIADVIFDVRPGERAGTVLLTALERNLLNLRGRLKSLYYRYKDRRKPART
ncbi:GNAT family N-acetyltransferase [Chelatococcus asaccharovorans]|uniref:CelD/BcsL family acetyltransferase involved in cellulose biosynthesis n=1 Tax=Chelatococcus asaccharovorans TaxID=28210 RepID=A0A2V3U3K9_9HYPH|nr:GNAT family N-acetyltransferase [Chelatococcus asaccharovorans]MBS7702964.1 GNAT family N-acetyltransferase [Chelatococcus asaccharovorans]PXW57263.1 CelD/BcsL family acetyltransferase involved in cellulose biosynthesis [Chelatococcus asaccharovorans]